MTSIRRIPLRERPFPDYTRDEERWNVATHVFGAMCALVMMWLAVRASLSRGSVMALVSNVVYVTTVLVTFVVSAIYHGLPKGMPKQVMRVVDHCGIFFAIAGTYTPITLLGIRAENAAMGWSLFAVEWTLALVGATLNAIDLNKYAKFSLVCYLGMGWGILIGMYDMILSMTLAGFLWMVGGGVAYTLGAVLYHIGKKKRYRHTLFHVLVVIAAVLQFIGIWQYLMI